MLLKATYNIHTLSTTVQFVDPLVGSPRTYPAQATTVAKMRFFVNKYMHDDAFPFDPSWSAVPVDVENTCRDDGTWTSYWLVETPSARKLQQYRVHGTRKE